MKKILISTLVAASVLTFGASVAHAQKTWVLVSFNTSGDLDTREEENDLSYATCLQMKKQYDADWKHRVRRSHCK